MTAKRLWVPMLLGLVFGGGCGDDGGAAVDAAPAADAVPAVDAEPADAGDCNALVQTGAEVAQTRVAEAAPASVGGALVDGTYHLTSDVLYTGVGGATGVTGLRSQITMSCTTGSCQIVLTETGTISGGPPHTTIMFGTAGTTLTQRFTCPEDVAGPAAAYSSVTDAGGTTFTVIETLGVNQRGRVYELQP